MIKSKEFREDLFYRLNVVTINLLPLRKRKDDIPLLINYFLEKFNIENSKSIKGFTKEAVDQLINYDFPANIRELENIIERVVVLSREENISKDELPFQFSENNSNKIFDPSNLDDVYETKMKIFGKAMINETLKRTNGIKSAAVRILGISVRHIRSRLERLD